jgi:hypothetical protein
MLLIVSFRILFSVPFALLFLSLLLLLFLPLRLSLASSTVKRAVMIMRERALLPSPTARAQEGSLLAWITSQSRRRAFIQVTIRRC